MDFDRRLDLTAAVLERDTLRRRYEEVVGTDAELEAYVDLNAAQMRVTALDRYYAWSEDTPLSGPASAFEEEPELHVR